jgi:hypothetical protein
MTVSNRLPAKSGEHGGDPALLVRSYLRGVDHQGVAGDVCDADARQGRDVLRYRGFPRVALEAIIPLGLMSRRSKASSGHHFAPHR